MIVDKETRDRYYRVVGSLETAHAVLKGAPVMPDDRATARLMKGAEALMKQALESAWEYANARTAEKPEDQEV